MKPFLIKQERGADIGNFAGYASAEVAEIPAREFSKVIDGELHIVERATGAILKRFAKGAEVSTVDSLKARRDALHTNEKED